MNKLCYIILSLVFQYYYCIQDDFMDYMNPREYTLAAITVDGVVHFDQDMIIQKSGLVRGEKIVVPGEKIIQPSRNYGNRAYLNM